MLTTNPNLAYRLVQERILDTLRETEDERLLRRAHGPRRLRHRWLTAGLLGRGHNHAEASKTR
jgi:hypothetical protein